jgi:hypothetical protein
MTMATMTAWITVSGANAYWINWWPGYPNHAPTYPSQPDTMDHSGMSTGGGAVAPVPQGPTPAAVTAAAPSAEPKIETYASCDVAAGACLAAFEAYQPPDYWHGKVARGERPVTSDTLRAAILRAAPSRSKKFRTEALDVGLRWADTSGVTFTVEGLRTE